MTTFADHAAAIRSRFETQFPTLRPSVPILWPNERLNPAPDPNTDGNGLQGWIAFEVRSGREIPAGFGGLGANRWRQSGEVIIRIFVPVTVGETLVRAVAADASSVFRGYQAGNLKFFEADTTGGDISEDGNWYELDSICHFTADIIA